MFPHMHTTSLICHSQKSQHFHVKHLFETPFSFILPGFWWQHTKTSNSFICFRAKEKLSFSITHHRKDLIMFEICVVLAMLAALLEFRHKVGFWWLICRATYFFPFLFTLSLNEELFISFPALAFLFISSFLMGNPIQNCPTVWEHSSSQAATAESSYSQAPAGGSRGEGNICPLSLR